MLFNEMNLNPLILKAITACGYDTPTPVQARSIPEALKGKHLVVTAQTGTGKTAAFIIPALERLTQTKSTGRARILVLTPTRELAAQVTDAAKRYGKFMKFNIISLVGGMPYRQQLKDLSGQVDIIVATPGRLLDHMGNKRDHKGGQCLDLSGIEILILDEADRMLDMGFIDDVKDIANATPPSRQTFLFSATVDNNLSGIIRQLTKDPVRIDFSAEKMSPALIKQELYMVDNIQHKNRLLQHFLDNEQIYKAIIFSATKINADYLANQLRDKGYEAAPLHGDLKQNVRNRTVEQLRRGRIQFLVATDIAARGIDIADITHVINYDVPKFSEDYVHRIGRTGRAGKTGTAISFALPTDMRHLQKIEKYVGQRFQIETIAGLEPTKQFNINSKSGPADSRKKYGRSGSGDSRSGKSYAPKSSSNGRSYSRDSDDRASSSRGGDARSGYAGRSNSRGGEGRNEYAGQSENQGGYAGHSSESRSSAPRASEGRGSYAGRSSEGRSSAPRMSEGRGGYAGRSSDSRENQGGGFANRSSESRSNAPRASEGRGGYAGRSSEGRSSSPRSSEGHGSYTGRSSEGRSSAPRSSEGRGSYAGRSSEGRSTPRVSEGRGGYAGRSTEGRSSAPSRSSESRGSYAGRGSEGRSSAPRSSGPQGAGFKDKSPRSAPFRSSSPRTSSKSTGTKSHQSDRDF